MQFSCIHNRRPTGITSLFWNSQFLGVQFSTSNRREICLDLKVKRWFNDQFLSPTVIQTAACMSWIFVKISVRSFCVQWLSPQSGLKNNGFCCAQKSRKSRMAFCFHQREIEITRVRLWANPLSLVYSKEQHKMPEKWGSHHGLGGS